MNIHKFSDNEIVPERIKIARISRGYSLSDLAEKLDITKQMISQYELGICSPTNILHRLTHVLGYPLNFFYKPIPVISSSSTTYFRSRKSTSKKLKEASEKKVDIFFEIKDYFENYIDYPKVNLPYIDTKEEYVIDDFENIARTVRKFWDLGNAPIDNLISELQKNGVIISKIKVGNNKIDAFSKWINGTPYIFLSTEKNSAVRSRFDAAHELAHLLLHQDIIKEDIENKEILNKIEKEADSFAAAFLMPAETFSREVFSSSFENFVALKSRWKVSISAMIRRCEDLNILSKYQIEYLKKQMSYKNFWHNEPLDDEIKIEKPYLYEQIIKLILDNNVINRNTLIEDLSIDEEEIEEYCYLKRGTISRKDDKIISLKNYM